MRIALVHDWLTGMRGGERVLQELSLLFPQADLYTLVHVPGATSEEIEGLRIRVSPLSRLPGVARHYRALLPLFPWAIGRFRPEGYDVVVSISHAVAKGIRVAPGVPHLCYCLTPMRYVWDQVDAYLGRGVRRAVAAPLVGYLRHWDRRTSRPERVTRFIAISSAVADRIRRHYRRTAPVIYPPVDVDRIQPRDGKREGFYLLTGGFVPYKRENLALSAFRALGAPLIVVGDGPMRKDLERRAPPNVSFLGRVSDAELAELYARCRALIYPQEEDFGIAAVEAQAAGAPVIAFGRGGATDTVVPINGPRDSAPTGVWFHDPTPEGLAAAVRGFEAVEHQFDTKAIRARAERPRSTLPGGTPERRRTDGSRDGAAHRTASSEERIQRCGIDIEFASP
jgi:glycosyltransferase involved in cell wall biosynthesis